MKHHNHYSDMELKPHDFFLFLQIFNIAQLFKVDFENMKALVAGFKHFQNIINIQIEEPSTPAKCQSAVLQVAVVTAAAPAAGW